MHFCIKRFSLLSTKSLQQTSGDVVAICFHHFRCDESLMILTCTFTLQMRPTSYSECSSVRLIVCLILTNKRFCRLMMLLAAHFLQSRYTQFVQPTSTQQAHSTARLFVGLDSSIWDCFEIRDYVRAESTRIDWRLRLFSVLSWRDV